MLTNKHYTFFSGDHAFGFLCNHVKPGNAISEIDMLADVYDHVTDKFGHKVIKSSVSLI